jgi:hypothetical protein
VCFTVREAENLIQSKVNDEESLSLI